MKATLILFPILFAANLFAQTSAFTDVSNSQKEHINSNSKPTVESRSITFIENKGQIHDQNYQPRPDVLFGAMAGNMAFHLKTNGVSYQLTKVDSYKEVEDLKTKEKRKEIDRQTIYRIDLSWINANANFTTSTDNILAGYDNYYTAGCAEGGALNVKSFTGVTAHHLYTGINLHYYEKAGQLKHDYIVAPGADYKKIQLNVKGATVSINEDGSLLLNTPLGKVQEGAPIVYQKGKQLKAKWLVKDQILSFDIENYNPKLELIIDPITRAWGTFYGGSSAEIAYACATDAAANVYMAGRTASSTNMATVGAHQTVYGTGIYDAFLVKFNANGVRQWGTYYGSGGNDMARSCATDAAGNVYMAGETNSTISISTPGAHQSVKGTGFDAFLVQFNASGVRQWGTYYGSTGGDYGYSCATDVTGNVYMAGYTTSPGTFSTTGAHQTTWGGGSDDAFLVKFNSSGVRQWGTYYGHLGSDQGTSCATDASGNVYLAGLTTSDSAIATTGAHQEIIGGNFDAFIVQFNTNGVRQWGTYYGSSSAEQGNSCVADPSGNIILAGSTTLNSGTVIATTGAHQAVHGGVNDAFLVKFNAGGVRQWGTYYGGTFNDYGYSCSSDASGNLYLAGFTASGSSMAFTTAGAHQTTNGGGVSDSYIAKFNASGVRQYGTFYGGNGDEESWGCAADMFGNFYLSGYTGSIPSVISTAGAHQSVNGGSIDAFLVKFSACSGASTTTINETACNAYTWLVNGTTYTNSGTYTETLVNAAGCDSIITLNLTINTVDNTTSLAGATASANAVGATYQWIDCDNGNIPISGATNQSFTPTVNGNYAVMVTQNGCSAVSNCVSITIVDVREITPFVGINVYPNPSNGLYTISGITANTNLTVLNSLGEVLYSSLASGTSESIDLSSLAKGIYFLKLNNKQNESILKISRL